MISLAGADDHPALVAPGKPTITYGQLRNNVAELGAELNRLGLGRGDRIALVMGNGPEMVIAYLAVTHCATAAPLNPKYKAEELAFYYEDTQAKAVIRQPGTSEAAVSAALPDMALLTGELDDRGWLRLTCERGPRPARPVEVSTAEDVAMILHTSGTTSRPKRVPIRHRNLAASAGNIVGTYGLDPADRALCVMPLFHIHGIVASLLATLASGGTVICPSAGFNALEFWSWIAQYRPTWYSAVPTMHQLLLTRAGKHAELLRTHPFRFVRSSSASLPKVVMEQLESTFGAPVVEAYGMTEASHQMASNPLPPAARKPGCVGYGFGVELGIMDADGRLLEQGALGEIVVKGPNVVDGYENNEEANRAAFVSGWFRTGDQGRIDPDGYLALTGRIKELINRGGEKISPLEIDDVLLRHPAVAEALAFAVPHKMLGEEVHAAVVLRDGADEGRGEARTALPGEGGAATAPPLEDGLRAHCAAFLAEFKVPRRVHVLTEIPRGPTGKLQRIQMAKLLGIAE